MDIGIDLTVNALWAALLGYAFGSIPFGLILARLAGKGDIRQQGSGNIGATNVLRTGSKWLAAATLLLDLAKGLLPVLLAKQLFPEAVKSLDFDRKGVLAPQDECLGLRG